MNRMYYLLMAMAIFLLAGCGSSLDDENDLSVDDTNAPMHLGVSETSSPTPYYGSPAPQIWRPDDHGGGYGWKRDKCILCHPARELKAAHEYSPALAESLSMLSDTDIGVCLYCHGSNGLGRVSAEMYQCMKCHTDSTIVQSANMFTGSSMHDVTADGWIDNADCVICHAFSDMNGEIDLDIDFRKGASRYTDLSSFCLNCHDGNGAFGILPPELSTGMGGGNLYSTYKGRGETSSAQKQTADIHGARNGWQAGHGSGGGGSSGHGPGSSQGPDAGHGQGPGQEGPPGQGSGQGSASLRGAYTYGMEVDCLDCHQVHSSDNPYLITQSGASAERADDAARQAPVTVTENDFTQLCAVCHTSLDGAPTDNGLTTVSHSGTYSAYCTDCHYHGAGFEGSGLF